MNVFAPELPYTLREQVLDYARSVEAASRDISKEAEMQSPMSFSINSCW